MRKSTDFEDFQSSLSRFVSELGDFVKGLEALPERIKGIIKQAADEDWLLPWWDMDPGELLAIGRGLTEHASREARDDFFATGFADMPATVAKEVGERFPDRKDVVLQGIDAHERGAYCLSILAFLSQADGIARACDVPNCLSEKNGKDVAEKLANYVADGSCRSLMQATITNGGKVGANGRNRPAPDRLNRHMALHGVRSDYGTKANSVRAALILARVCYFARVASEVGKRGG